MLGDFDSRFHVSLVVRFRSLFSWIMLGDRGTDLRVVHVLKFRSLFSWIMLGDTYTPTVGLADGTYVSILVLLDHAGRLVPRWWESWMTDVSILVLLDHAGRPRKNPWFAFSVIAVFRSLFSWIMLGDPKIIVGKRLVKSVSILVLLDHAGRL